MRGKDLMFRNASPFLNYKRTEVWLFALWIGTCQVNAKALNLKNLGIVKSLMIWILLTDSCGINNKKKPKSVENKNQLHFQQIQAAINRNHEVFLERLKLLLQLLSVSMHKLTYTLLFLESDVLYGSSAGPKGCFQCSKSDPEKC